METCEWSRVSFIASTFASIDFSFASVTTIEQISFMMVDLGFEINLIISSFEDITYSGNFIAYYCQNFINFTIHLVFIEGVKEVSSKIIAMLYSLTSLNPFQ